MLRKIQTLHFVLLCNPQADGQVNELQDGKRSDNCQRPGKRHSGELIQKLMDISHKRAGSENVAAGILENRINRDAIYRPDCRPDRQSEASPKSTAGALYTFEAALFSHHTYFNGVSVHRSCTSVQ